MHGILWFMMGVFKIGCEINQHGDLFISFSFVLKCMLCVYDFFLSIAFEEIKVDVSSDFF